MKKREVEHLFRTEIMPEIREQEKEIGMIDLPKRREAWNVVCDTLQKAGRINRRQYSSWQQPRECLNSRCKSR